MRRDIYSRSDNIKLLVRWPRRDRGFETADPGREYRPYLEANIGVQKFDWDWGLAGMSDDDVGDFIYIYLTSEKGHFAPIIALKWG